MSCGSPRTARHRVAADDVGIRISRSAVDRNPCGKENSQSISTPEIVPDSATHDVVASYSYLVTGLAIGGTGGIRTLGPVKVGRFQGGCIRPLCHRSAREASAATLRGSQERCQSGRMGRPAKALIAAM